MSIRFADLPSGRTSRNAWGEEAAALRANPGKWAHIEDYDENTQAQKGSFTQGIKSGRLKAFRGGNFDAKVIKGQVWVRFIGDAA